MIDFVCLVQLCVMLCMLLLYVCDIIQGAEIISGTRSQAYTPDMDAADNEINMFNLDAINDVNNEVLLSRSKRDLKWEDVEKFYEDKNNFAMFLVLPIIVLVYGGCAVIYCIARCRRYAKRRKKKSKSKEALAESEPLESPSNIAQGAGVTTIASANGGLSSRDGAATSSEVLVGMDESGTSTPLPWQVPGESQYEPPPKGAVAGTVVTAAAIHNKRQPLPSNQYLNNGFEDDFSSVPPPYEESMNNYHRPASKPPPYSDNGKKRRESVEEIISLDPMPVPTNDRKRRRSGGVPTPIPPPPDKHALYDEERERARALVRGDKPKRVIPPRDRQSDRERTPDIISHARTRPLEPRYKPAQEATDPNAMAKQAAQLLRLDHLGKQQGKKQKRLVFVAE